MLSAETKLLSTDPLKDLIKEDLGEDYLLDLWFYDFATHCLDVFGSPTALRGCMNIEDEVYYTYCAAALVLSLKEFPDIWSSLRDKEPIEAAYSFAEYYRNCTGSALIPPYMYSETLKGVQDESIN